MSENSTDDKFESFIEMSTELQTRVYELQSGLNSPNEVHDYVDKLSEVTGKYTMIINDTKSTNTDKVLASSDSKMTLLDVRSTIKQIYNELSESKSDLDSLNEYVKNLKEQGLILLESCQSDLELMRVRGITDQNLMEIVLDRIEILNSAIVSLDAQSSQVTSLLKTISPTHEKLSYVTEQLLPTVLMQVNTNNILLKMDLIEEIDGTKLLKLDLDGIYSCLNEETLSEDPKQRQLELLGRQSISIKNSLKRIMEENKDKNYVGKSVIESDITKLLTQIEDIDSQLKLGAGVLNSDK